MLGLAFAPALEVEEVAVRAAPGIFFRTCTAASELEKATLKRTDLEVGVGRLLVDLVMLHVLVLLVADVGPEDQAKGQGSVGNRLPTLYLRYRLWHSFTEVFSPPTCASL